MTKAELVAIVADKVEGVTKAQAAELYDAIFDTIGKALEVDKKYSVSGFGTFKAKDRPARTGRNPKTGESIQIAASTSVGFAAGSELKGRFAKK